MQGIGSGVTLGIVDRLPQVRGLAKRHLGVCGHATLEAGSGRWCQPVHCGHVTPVTLSGGGLIQETVDM